MPAVPQQFASLPSPKNPTHQTHGVFYSLRLANLYTGMDRRIFIMFQLIRISSAYPKPYYLYGPLLSYIHQHKSFCYHKNRGFKLKNIQRVVYTSLVYVCLYGWVARSLAA